MAQSHWLDGFNFNVEEIAPSKSLIAAELAARALVARLLDRLGVLVSNEAKRGRR